MLNKGDFYPRRDGTKSPYVIGQFKDITDLNFVIPLMKSLNYPFVIDNWYNYIDSGHSNPVGRYISLMNIGNFKPLTFEDSKHINNNSRNLKRLYEEIDNTLYYEVTDKIPELTIEIEEIKSNTVRKPKYLIAYDENDNPTVKFKYIKDMNITFDYNTTSTQDAMGHTVFHWISDKTLSTNFTCDEIEVFSSENKTQNITTNEYNNELPKVEKETDFTKEVDAFIRSLKGE